MLGLGQRVLPPGKSRDLSFAHAKALQMLQRLLHLRGIHKCLLSCETGWI